MLRRKLTRIELKLDDLDEWNTMRKEKEMEKRLQNLSKGNADTTIADCSMTSTSDGKTKEEIIHERIGFDPKGKPSSNS